MKSRAFTLIELAIVLAIVAILAAILTPLVANYIEQARITQARADAIATWEASTKRFQEIVAKADATRKILECLGLPSRAPPLTPAIRCAGRGEMKSP